MVDVQPEMAILTTREKKTFSNQRNTDMIIIKRFGNQTDSVSARIEQNEVHGKFCAQIYHHGEKGSWFGWCDDTKTVDNWVKTKLEIPE
jgi:hypothetical protein